MRVPGYCLLDEGARFPRRWGWPWGLAWRDALTYRAVILPVPINLLVGALRWLYFALLHGVRPHKLEQARAQVAHLEQENKDMMSDIAIAKQAIQSVSRMMQGAREG